MHLFFTPPPFRSFVYLLSDHHPINRLPLFLRLPFWFPCSPGIYFSLQPNGVPSKSIINVLSRFIESFFPYFITFLRFGKKNQKNDKYFTTFLEYLFNSNSKKIFILSTQIIPQKILESWGWGDKKFPEYF